MLNQKYYPFERNRYYFGKLLTAKDFENEQAYFNDKRRLINRTALGTGVACGLNVYAADDVSLIIETGVAIDEKGREIVVDEAVIKKITTIDGFNKTTKDELYLGIEYTEEDVDKAYAPMSPKEDEKNEEYNKVKENYRLFIEEEESIEKPVSTLSLFVEETIIYQNEEIIVRQYTPKFANDRNHIRVRVELEKLGTAQKTYSLTYQLDLQGFKTSNGESFIDVTFNHCTLRQSQKITQEYILSPENHLDSDLQFKVNPDRFALIKDEKRIGTLNQEIKIDLQIKKENMWDWIVECYYSQSLDAINTQFTGQKIWLAKVKLIRTNNTCLIDRVQAMPFSQYLYNAEQLMLGEKLSEYYPPKGQAVSTPIVTISHKENGENINQNIDMYEYLATGIVEIPIGISASTRETIFSDEIMHGLGKGSIYIDLGVEYVREKQDNKESSSEIILGEAALFDEIKEETIKIRHAIKVYKDKGTFVIAMRLEEASKLISIRVRWFAVKLPETEFQLNNKNLEGKTMMISPDTIVLTPRESITFSPIFINMEEEPCSYEVLEQEGGMITNMGVYTAPSKEGVYTIQIKTLSKTDMKANAFVVVKQQKEEHK